MMSLRISAYGDNKAELEQKLADKINEFLGLDTDNKEGMEVVRSRDIGVQENPSLKPPKAVYQYYAEMYLSII